MNFGRNKEEEHSVCGGKNETRKKERSENENGITNVACSVQRLCLTVLEGTSDGCDCDTWRAPTDQVIVFLQRSRTRVSLHDHLVKVEGNAKTPEEVGKEKVVDQSAKDCAPKGLGFGYPIELRSHAK